ncbi:hypothetical protein PP182_19385 [Maribacter sp. PR1]|uniref:Uncharacterized protein n=1 Tax=Maribacter cobaltidurans TaxID=1178778 RepID=A0ABU7IZ40_9FLAO|nr:MULTISPECIES: hypothetical protein [Maribacter]MDC6390857.1 hypothetical protein [Maribacter sp. PR1]MEE1978249.1 hypothetical protein [Maribacter cobaltidurans]
MTLFFIGCVQKETLDLDPNDLEFVEEPAVQERETQLSVVAYKEIPQVMDELYLRLSDTGKSIKNGKLKYSNVDIDLKEIKKVLKNGG